MALAFNEEQRALKDTAKDFVQTHAPVEALRQLRDNNDPQGYSQAQWRQMLELGWGGMILPEAYGGFDFGIQGLAGCMEEFGRTLVASPILSSIVLSGSTLLYGASESQKQELLPAVAGGETLIALALDEGPHHSPVDTALQALEDGDQFVLNGDKTLVMDGHIADQLLVVARTLGQPGDEDGLSLFLVCTDAPGICIERLALADSRNYARIRFNQVKVSKAALIGDRDIAFPALDRALDLARICLAAEMFGGIQEVFERTVEYLKERKQFGQKIGCFQALQHRCSHLYSQIQLCKTALMQALDALESDVENAASLVSAAKALICETYELATNEATQLHGGIGVTDELEIGFFLKRARVAQILLGDANFHYNRYASLQGY